MGRDRPLMHWNLGITDGTRRRDVTCHRELNLELNNLSFIQPTIANAYRSNEAVLTSKAWLLTTYDHYDVFV